MRPQPISPGITGHFAPLRIAGGMTLGCAMVFAVTPSALALVLGNLEIRSSLGEPLSAWVAYSVGQGESINADCVRLAPDARGVARDVPALAGAKPRLQSQRGTTYIVFESASAVNEPVVRLIVDVRCAPPTAMTREYVAFLDPPGASRPAPTEAVAAGEPGEPRPPAKWAAYPPVEPRQRNADEPTVAPSPRRRPEARNPSRSQNQKSEGRPVLRLMPPEENLDAAGREIACCFKLSYELTQRTGPPLSETEREALRQELRDPLERLRAARAEADLLKQRLAAAVQASKESEAPSQAQTQSQSLSFRPSGLQIALAAIVLALGLWTWRRMLRRRSPPDLQPDTDAPRVGGTVAPARAIPVLTTPVTKAAAPAAGRDVFSSLGIDFDVSRDAPPPAAGLAESPDDPARRAADYKRAYIAARFPEIAAGNIVLNNDDSVIEAARIFYQEDHNTPKAVELLQIALSIHRDHVRLWLALFEILSQERMAPDFAVAARRYQTARDRRVDPYWPTIAKLGRDLDPDNELYRADGLPPVDGSHPNWLNSQLDMMGDTLALELRTQLLQAKERS